MSSRDYLDAEQPLRKYYPSLLFNVETFFFALVDLFTLQAQCDVFQQASFNMWTVAIYTKCE